MPTPSPTEAALAAHQAALEARATMTRLAHERDEAIRKAIEAGVSAIQLAQQLGITRQRVYAMARSAQSAD